MGASEFKRRGLQGIDVLTTCLTIIALLSMSVGVNAQITPFHATLEYSADLHEWPTATIKAANGSSAYVLKFQQDKNITGTLSHLDLVLHRPGANADARNLLEPAYRWHGLQEYMFSAIDFKDGPERSVFGQTRHLVIKNRKLDVTLSLSKVEVAPLNDHPSGPFDYVFKQLAIDVDVENLK